MVYVYLPFMLFPMTLGVSMVPQQTRDAAFDLGATRWQVFREVDLPLAMPGIVIGFLLTFVLAVGAIAEAKVLGGQRIIPITHDIEISLHLRAELAAGRGAFRAVDAGRRHARARSSCGASISTPSWGRSEHGRFRQIACAAH